MRAVVSCLLASSTKFRFKGTAPFFWDFHTRSFKHSWCHCCRSPELVPVRAPRHISCWMTELKAGSETQCRNVHAHLLCRLSSLPHMHLSNPSFTHSFVIICPSYWQVTFAPSRMSHIFTFGEELLLLTPLNIPQLPETWKGVSALVSPWGETATDSSLPDSENSGRLQKIYIFRIHLGRVILPFVQQIIISLLSRGILYHFQHADLSLLLCFSCHSCTLWPRDKKHSLPLGSAIEHFLTAFFRADIHKDSWIFPHSDKRATVTHFKSIITLGLIKDWWFVRAI